MLAAVQGDYWTALKMEAASSFKHSKELAASMLAAVQGDYWTALKMEAASSFEYRVTNY